MDLPFPKMRYDHTMPLLDGRVEVPGVTGILEVQLSQRVRLSARIGVRTRSRLLEFTHVVYPIFSSDFRDRG